MRPQIRSTLPLLLAAATLAACAKAPESKTPLGAPPAQTAESSPAAASALGAGARSALDRGNEMFRAGKYDSALAHYRAAAKAAPDHAAPFYGIYMAAKKLGQDAVADSAHAEIGKRNAAAAPTLSDSALQAAHAKPNG